MWMTSARSFGRHSHDSFGFGVMDAGAHRSASGRGPVLARPGDIITSNPGEVHDGQPLNGASRRWRMVQVTPATLKLLLDNQELELTRPVLEDPALRCAIHRVFQRWDELPTCGAPSAIALWEEAMTQACGLLAERHGQSRQRPAPGQAGLNQVRESLLDRLIAPPSLNELAHLAGLSRFQLIRQFSRAHGLPPFAWLQQQRLRRAREWIAAGAALSDTALACGFADQSHLNRHFMRCFGYTPGQWQRASRGRAQ